LNDVVWLLGYGGQPVEKAVVNQVQLAAGDGTAKSDGSIYALF